MHFKLYYSPTGTSPTGIYTRLLRETLFTDRKWMRSEQRVRQPVLARNAYRLYVLQKIRIRALFTFALSLFHLASRFRRSTYKTTKKKKKFSFYHLRFGESSSTITLIIHVAEDKSNRHAQYSFWILFLLSFNRWLIWGMVTDSSLMDHARYSFWIFFY